MMRNNERCEVLWRCSLFICVIGIGIFYHSRYNVNKKGEGDCSLEYTVKKDKRTRIGLRILGLLFLLMGIFRIGYILFFNKNANIIVTMMLCIGGFGYGWYLFINTFKAKAYDIVYQFKDKTMTLKLHYKDLTIDYSEIVDLGFVIPNDNMDYAIIQLYIGKEQYIIPFMNCSNVGKALYEMLLLKRKEANKD